MVLLWYNIPTVPPKSCVEDACLGVVWHVCVCVCVCVNMRVWVRQKERKGVSEWLWREPIDCLGRGSKPSQVAETRSAWFVFWQSGRKKNKKNEELFLNRKIKKIYKIERFSSVVIILMHTNHSIMFLVMCLCVHGAVLLDCWSLKVMNESSESVPWKMFCR